MRLYETMKAKTTQSILPDSHSLKEHVKRANLQACYWRHYLEHNLTKVDHCRAGWLRETNEINGLKPFWYECRQLPTSMKRKRKSQAKGKRVDLVKQSRAIHEIYNRTRKNQKRVTIMTLTLQVKVTFVTLTFTKNKLFQWFIYI